MKQLCPGHTSALQQHLQLPLKSIYNALSSGLGSLCLLMSPCPPFPAPLAAARQQPLGDADAVDVQHGRGAGAGEGHRGGGQAPAHHGEAEGRQGRGDRPAAGAVEGGGGGLRWLQGGGREGRCRTCGPGASRPVVVPGPTCRACGLTPVCRPAVLCASRTAHNGSCCCCWLMFGGLRVAMDSRSLASRSLAHCCVHKHDLPVPHFHSATTPCPSRDSQRHRPCPLTASQAVPLDRRWHCVEPPTQFPCCWSPCPPPSLPSSPPSHATCHASLVQPSPGLHTP